MATNIISADMLPQDGSLWLNTGGRPWPISTEFVYLICFWSAASAHSIEALQLAQRLANTHSDKPIVVIGVHQPHFDPNLQRTAALAALALRGIRCAVVLDAEGELPQMFSATQNGAIAIIGPRHNLLGCLTASDPETLESFVLQAATITSTDPATKPRPVPEPQPHDADAPLVQPTRLLPDLVNRRILIADTGNHRILVATPTGVVTQQIGSGEPGLRDGGHGSAQFRLPQGMALAGNSLFVCDTGNHVIRCVSLVDNSVSTVAGMGRPLQNGDKIAGARTTPISSPWDICYLAGSFYIAAASCNQIWRFRPGDETLRPVAGSGARGRDDGHAVAASFAQPAGIATDGECLYVIDSRSGCVRRVTIGVECFVKTLAGGNVDDWGDRDGEGASARFQNPQGIWCDEGQVLIADTFNNRIKTLATQSGVVANLAGDGLPGKLAGPAAEARFNQPIGVSAGGGKVWICDSGNGRIRVLDLLSREVTTLRLDGIAASE
ncbi:MAG: hypothetical protein KGJ62_02010 [Armatimonadetes bacterium]|nr:hypothetical protein [Armatimonadota bacterium]MDE2206715.1 hypothetical protein [Armatimonadota bacterium]